LYVSHIRAIFFVNALHYLFVSWGKVHPCRNTTGNFCCPFLCTLHHPNTTHNTSHIKSLETCRRALYQSAQCAIGKAREARLEHEEEQAREAATREEEKRRADEERRAEKDAARQRRREEWTVAKAVEKERRKRELKKKLPQNVELWREVAMFMTELTKLEKEEQLWKEMEENLKTRESELSVREKEEQHVQEDEVDEIATQKKDALEIQVEHAVEDITLSSLRIQQALRFVSDLVVQSNTAQKELYDKYTKDHQFHGYRGVKNPKALIRAIITD
jgi:flagellar biosynthesis GTPase FlhF